MPIDLLRPWSWPFGGPTQPVSGGVPPLSSVVTQFGPIMRLPAVAKSDWGFDATNAPVDTSSVSWINWHATDTGHNGLNYMNPLGGDVDGIPGHVDSAGSLEYYSYHFLLANNRTPIVSVHCRTDGFLDTCDGVVPGYLDSRWMTNTFRIPAEPIGQRHYMQAGLAGGEANPTGNPDRHLTVYNVDSNEIYELYVAASATQPPAYWSTDHWEVAAASKFDMTSVASTHALGRTTGSGRGSANAAGMVALAGVCTYGELYNLDGLGDLTHGTALATSAINAILVGPTLHSRYCYPATHGQDAVLFTGAIPLGARLRLRPSFNIDAAITDAAVMAAGGSAADAAAMRRWLRSLAKYGMILMDGSGLDLQPHMGYDPRWNNTGLTTTEFPSLVGTGAQQLWVNAFRFGTGLADWRPSTFADSLNASYPHTLLPRAPTWWDFEVVQRGWGVGTDSDIGQLYTF